MKVFDREYTEEDYNLQFSVRVDKYLEKVVRMEEVFRPEPNMPDEFWQVLSRQKADFEALKAETGESVLPPGCFPTI